MIFSLIKVKIFLNKMLDIKFIRENKDIVAMGAKKKHINFDVDKLISVDDQRLEILKEVEEMRSKQNEVSQQIPQADEEQKQTLLAEMSELKKELQQKEEKLKDITTQWQKLMVQVPNIPDMSVPEGATDEDNKELRVVGEKPNLDFDAKDHIQLMTEHDLADFERGTKISGFRGYVLKNEGALLQWAILQYVQNKIVQKGYKPLVVPSLVNRQTLIGTGYLPQGEEDLYKTQDDEYLAGTAEVATMYYHSDETLDKQDLPIKYVSYAPAFRREAGSHGKDTKGLVRVHEFHKIEQVILCEANHEESVKYHEELLANTEEIMQELEIPYRVVVNAGGDLGLGQVKKYDIEAWVPSENKYRETHSASYFHDFQTRRLGIKYKDDGKNKFAHSLNNTAIACPRILVPIIENNQQPDGSIKIPKVLVPYIGKEFIGRKEPNEESAGYSYAQSE
ncbi:serine--tRNA ligase [Candidatus Parcubacteria bacterium]|nr:serine--tRNA ligase [Candidatus Parcubacteria bacterium]